MLKYYLDKTGKVIKSILFPSSEFVDTEPRVGSMNPVTSGGVAGSVAQQSSNIAPDYTKKTYEANSYVMHGGVLYTNPNAIGTAEDWNPAHWTQTTVAEMMANAGGGEISYTSRSVGVELEDDATVRVNQKDVLEVYVDHSWGGQLTFDISGVTDAYIKLLCTVGESIDQSNIFFEKDSNKIFYQQSLSYLEYSDVAATLIALDSSRAECNSANAIVYRIVGDTVLCLCTYVF